MPASRNSIHSVAGTSSSFTNTVSTDDTETTSRTVPGPGALTGKAILAIGKATLRGAEILIIRRRLQVISSKFPHTDNDDIKGIEHMYEDLLEFSRCGYYSDTTRARALRMILVQIGGCQIGKLSQCLRTWSPIEIQYFIWDLTQLFDPFRLSDQKKAGKLPGLVQAYQTSLVNGSAHSLNPLIHFFFKVLWTKDHTINIMESGVMDFLVHLYILGFSDPLVKIETGSFHERSTLQTECNSLLETYSKSEHGMVIISKHHLHVLWPKSYFFRDIPDKSTRRAQTWRLMRPDAIFFRAKFIYNMVVAEDWWSLVEMDSLHDVSVDILEFLEQPIYQDAAKAYIIDMAAVLICGHRTEPLFNFMETWPISGIKNLMIKLIIKFHSLWLFITGITEELPHTIQLEHILTDPLESFVIFLKKLAQTHVSPFQEILEGGTLDFLDQVYTINSFHPLFKVADFQSACHSLLKACSTTQTGLEVTPLWQPLDFQLVPPESPYADLMPLPDWHVQRAQFWRFVRPQVVFKRVTLMMDIVQTTQSTYGGLFNPIEAHTLSYIITDTLEFFGVHNGTSFRHHQYPPTIKLCALDIISVLIGSCRTKGLVHNLTRRPSQQLTKMVITSMTKIFDPPWPFIKKKVEDLPQMVRAYEGSLSGQESHSLEPLVTFIIQVVQTGCITLGSEGTITDLLFHLYMSDFLDPLRVKEPTEPLSNTKIRELCNVLIVSGQKPT